MTFQGTSMWLMTSHKLHLSEWEEHISPLEILSHAFGSCLQTTAEKQWSLVKSNGSTVCVTHDGMCRFDQ